MLKKILLGLFLLLCTVFVWFYSIGQGWLGSDWQAAPVTGGPRLQHPSVSEQSDNISAEQQTKAESYDTPQVLFGDLHSHTKLFYRCLMCSTLKR